MLERIRAHFELDSNGTDFRRETVAGITTFMTMACIIVVNPAVLGAADGDLREAVVRLRRWLVEAVPVGLFLTFVGLNAAGIVELRVLSLLVEVAGPWT